jgi:hypothetical protein
MGQPLTIVAVPVRTERAQAKAPIRSRDLDYLCLRADATCPRGWDQAERRSSLAPLRLLRLNGPSWLSSAASARLRVFSRPHLAKANKGFEGGFPNVRIGPGAVLRVRTAPNADFAIIPGTTHYNLMLVATEAATDYAKAFLAE